MAFHVAVINVNISVVRVLIKSGFAGSNDLDADEFPPLCGLLFVSEDERVCSSMEVLVELGVDINHAMPCDSLLASDHTL